MIPAARRRATRKRVTGYLWGDNFDRANETPLSNGGAWSLYGTSGSNRAGVVSNYARANVATTDGTYYSRCRWDLNTAIGDDMFVRATLVGTGGGSINSQIGLRLPNAGDPTSMVGLYMRNGAVLIGSAVSGTYTDRTASLATPAAGDVWTLTAQGNVYRAYLAGVLMGTWTDSGNVAQVGAGNRKAGLGLTSSRGFFTNTYSPALDNWQAGDLAAITW